MRVYVCGSHRPHTSGDNALHHLTPVALHTPRVGRDTLHLSIASQMVDLAL